MTIDPPWNPTVENLEAALSGRSLDEVPEASPAPPQSWPDLLRLLADVLQEGIPLLEGGKKANVFALLLVFAKLQAAWAAFKSLRNPPPAA